MHSATLSVIISTTKIETEAVCEALDNVSILTRLISVTFLPLRQRRHQSNNRIHLTVSAVSQTAIRVVRLIH